MKYIIVLSDGMADLPNADHKNKTPMETASFKNIRSISSSSLQGIVSSIPKGMEPGSDVANLSILGYDPKIHYKGRSSIEAASLGIDLLDDDLALRANLVTLDTDESFDGSIMKDHGADDITTQEAHELIDFLSKELSTHKIKLHKGTSYRNLAILNAQKSLPVFTPPHDILGQVIGSYLPKGSISEHLTDIMIKSHALLCGHHINIQRLKKGLNPANSLWFWGAGRKMSLPSFYELFNLNGGVISAVDLIKGIGCLSGMKIIDVPGATGTIDTDYAGKVNACIKSLANGLDFIYLHVEAPDECGHKGDFVSKAKAIELIDERIIGPILKSEDLIGPFKLMVLPDHATPVMTRTHASDPVPFLIYDSSKKYAGLDDFSEKSAISTGIHISDGNSLMRLFTK